MEVSVVSCFSLHMSLGYKIYSYVQAGDQIVSCDRDGELTCCYNCVLLVVKQWCRLQLSSIVV